MLLNDSAMGKATPVATLSTAQESTQNIIPAISRIKKRGYLKVAIVPFSVPPFILYNTPKSSIPTGGVLIDLLDKIASYLHVSVHYDIAYPNTMDALILKVANGEDDISANLLIMPQRALLVRFSTPIYQEPQALLVNRINAMHKLHNAQTYEQLRRQPLLIGLLTGSADYQQSTSAFSNAHYQYFPTINKLLDAVNQGKVDSLYLPLSILSYYLAHDPKLLLNTKVVLRPGSSVLWGLALNYKDKNFAIWLNTTLESLQASNFIKNTIKRYSHVNHENN